MTGDVFKCSFLEGRVKAETFSIIEKKNPSTTGALVIKSPSRCKKRARLCLPVSGLGPGQTQVFWGKEGGGGVEPGERSRQGIVSIRTPPRSWAFSWLAWGS